MTAANYEDKTYNLKDILKMFNIDTDIELYGNGHINDTYLVNITPKFILQRINTKVFKNPEQVMSNIYRVTEHLRKKIIASNGDEKRETLTIIPTIHNETYYKHDEDAYFRMYNFVDNSVSLDVTDNLDVITSAGKTFGKFQKLLSDFPAETLFETIPDFHNTPCRIEQLNTAVSKDCKNRVKDVADELAFAKEYSKYASAITGEIAKGTVLLRITHNDTKLNNVLFDEKTLEGICVIDLDTVMPGSVLYDYGDALRTSAASAAEDETDPSKISFDLSKFEAFTKGFLSETGKHLTKAEIKLLPLAPLIMTYECGIRFLADYINGDTYFKIHKEHHNLDRARNQFLLVKDIEQKLEKMETIIAKYL